MEGEGGRRAIVGREASGTEDEGWEERKGWRCASRLLIFGEECEAPEALLEVGGLVGEQAVGRLAVPLQATLALELWEEGGSLAES